ncbi:MAG: LemA family protein [Patescibacteria group bacterium]
MAALYILIGFGVLILIVVVSVYNGLVAAQQRIQEAWSDIEVQLKRRYDLIPNVVEMVKGYASHERETFDRVIQARSQAMQPGSAADHAKAENMLSGALKSLFALAEAYPDLKANQNFGKLQDELSDTENKIQAARRFYNGSVRDFNTKLVVFPSNVIAGFFGAKFKEREYFDLDEEVAARENVKVKF